MGVYELLDYHGEDTFPNMIEALGAFRDGMQCYQAGRRNDARSSLKQVLKLNPANKCSEDYLERCDYPEENVKDEGWDGVWTMTSK